MADAYTNYSGLTLTPELVEKYFRTEIQEHLCPDCYVRWYSPAVLGESDFYEHLDSFPGYYHPDSWDKVTVLDILTELGGGSAVDIGCGDGWLLRRAANLGVRAFGTEINRGSVAKAQKEGLEVYLPDAPELTGRTARILVTLQTLEHVHQPVQWLQSELTRFKPEVVIIAVPACDTMLGYTCDPLAWPPHHFTQWSERALKTLAGRLNLLVDRIIFEPNDWQRFNRLLEAEKGRQLYGMPPFPRGRVGHACFKLARMLGAKWALRAHTALAVFRVHQTVS